MLVQVIAPGKDNDENHHRKITQKIVSYTAIYGTPGYIFDLLYQSVLVTLTLR